MPAPPGCSQSGLFHAGGGSVCRVTGSGRRERQRRHGRILPLSPRHRWGWRSSGSGPVSPYLQRGIPGRVSDGGNADNIPGSSFRRGRKSGCRPRLPASASHPPSVPFVPSGFSSAACPPSGRNSSGGGSDVYSRVSPRRDTYKKAPGQPSLS